MKTLLGLHVLSAVMLTVTSAVMVLQERPGAVVFGACAVTMAACSVVWAVYARQGQAMGKLKSTGRHSHSSSVE